MNSIEIKAGDVATPQGWLTLQNQVEKKYSPDTRLLINLEQTHHTNLIQFNQLVVLYCNQKRKGIRLLYKNFGDSIRRYVDKTNFHHVFLDQ